MLSLFSQRPSSIVLDRDPKDAKYIDLAIDLRPYQQIQAHLLRKKLELLEHAIEHASLANEHAKGTTASKSGIDLDEELREIDQLRSEISSNAQRLARAFN